MKRDDMCHDMKMWWFGVVRTNSRDCTLNANRWMKVFDLAIAFTLGCGCTCECGWSRCRHSQHSYVKPTCTHLSSIDDSVAALEGALLSVSVEALQQSTTTAEGDVDSAPTRRLHVLQDLAYTRHPNRCTHTRDTELS